jgi:phosphohistidine phosphatase
VEQGSLPEMSVDTPRRIVVLRNAEAERSDGDDHERPLADRGRKDAPPVAGRWLAGSRSHPRSGAVLHGCPLPRDMEADRPRAAGETQDCLLGHNPGVHALADALAGEVEGDLLARMNGSGFPTAAMAVIAWKSVEHGVGRLVAYWTPQN